MRRPSFTIEQLRSFVAVAEHGHVSRAAASLFLTQAAVTQQVRNFERALGLQLLERDGRGVRLTDAGRSMADACRAALRAVEVVDDSALAMIGDAYDQVEVLNLGHPEYVRAAVVAGLGFAALSKRAVASEIHTGLLRRLPIRPLLRSITAVRRADRGGPSQEAFWDLLTRGAVAASTRISADGYAAGG